MSYSSRTLHAAHHTRQTLNNYLTHVPGGTAESLKVIRCFLKEKLHFLFSDIHNFSIACFYSQWFL